MRCWLATTPVIKSFELGFLSIDVPLHSIECRYNARFQLFLVFARAKDVVHFITKLLFHCRLRRQEEEMAKPLKEMPGR